MKKKLKLNHKEISIVLNALGKAKIPVITRNDVPPGVIYFMSGDLPPQEWDNSGSVLDEAPRAKVIDRFLKRLNPRRIEKIVSLASQKQPFKT